MVGARKVFTNERKREARERGSFSLLNQRASCGRSRGNGDRGGGGSRKGERRRRGGLAGHRPGAGVFQGPAEGLARARRSLERGGEREFFFLEEKSREIEK